MIEIIVWMNDHAKVRGDTEWIELPLNDKSQDTLKVFFGIVIYKGMFRVPYKYIFSGSFCLGCEFISKVLPRKVFRLIFRHIRFGPTSLGDEEGPPHPYRSFLQGQKLFQKYSRELWNLGKGKYSFLYLIQKKNF